jgi:hypothetical protein
MWGGVLAVVGILIATATPVAAQSAEKALEGSYNVHDLFVLRGGSDPWTRFGQRVFDADQGVAETTLATNREAPLLQDDLALHPGDTFAFRTSAVTGTFAIGGALAVHSDTAQQGQDVSLFAGYTGMRISSLRLAGVGTGNFWGDYSYHSLVGTTAGSWRTRFGGALANGNGNLLLTLWGGSSYERQYSVNSTGGISWDGAAEAFGSLALDGLLAFETLRSNENEDPVLSSTHEGLAIYVLRGSGYSEQSLRGTYRVHEIGATGNGSPLMGFGTVTSPGNGYFSGTLQRNGQNASVIGSVSVNDSGTFALNGGEVAGTICKNGQIVVLATEQPDGNAGARLQIWLRQDAPVGFVDDDKDGLSNSEELQRGTSRTNPDTDGDGLLDGYDSRPLTRDDTLELSHENLVFQATDGAASPVAQTVRVESGLDPYYRWSAAAHDPWLTVSPTQGLADAELEVLVDTSDMAWQDSPYTGTITVTAPAMQVPDKTVTVVVEVAPGAPELSVAPANLAFESVQGGSSPSPQQVEVTNTTGAPFSWEASTTAPWISVSPSSGTGAQSANVHINSTNLVSANSPYTASLRFTPTNATGADAVVAVTVDVEPSRSIGNPFPLARSFTAQSQPAGAAHPATGDWAVAWIEGGRLKAVLLDDNGSEAAPPVTLSPATTTARNPVVVAVPGVERFWVICTQEILGEDSEVVWYRFDGADGSGSMNVGADSQETRGAVSIDKMALVPYVSNKEGTYDLRLLHASFMAPPPMIGAAILVEGAGDERFPHIAGAPERDTALVVWTHYDTPQAAGQVQAMLVSSDAIPLSAASPIDSDHPLANQINPRAAYDPTADEWVVVWEQEEGTDRAVYVARLDGSSAETLEVKLLAPPSLKPASPDLAFSPAAQQGIACWNATSLSPAASLNQRLTTMCQTLGEPAAISPAGFIQGTTRTAYNPVSGEFLLVWEDARNGTLNIHAMRVTEGSPDEDSDGLPNDWELRYGLDPFGNAGEDGASGDTDADGLTHGNEHALGTDPTAPDSDEDGLLDGQEDTNRNGTLDSGESSPALADSDADGFNDGAEVFGGSDPLSLSETPASGIVRVGYAPFEPGASQEITVHVVAAEAGTYTLTLNGAGWTSPAEWSTDRDSAFSEQLAQGDHELVFSATAPSETRIGSAGTFLLSFNGPHGTSTATAVVPVDPFTTHADAEALAQRFMPVLKLHTTDELLPVGMEQLHASLLPGASGAELDAFGLDTLSTLRNREAALDLDAESTDDIAALPLGTCTVYYSVFEARPLEDANKVIVQYYVRYHGDLWGTTIQGGYDHEGDWECIQVNLDDQLQPETIVVTHQGSNGIPLRSVWQDVEVLAESHPCLYFGLGSHAPHLSPGSARYAEGLDVHDGRGVWLTPAWEDSAYSNAMAPVLEALPRLTEAPYHWLHYAGRWGQEALPQAVDNGADVEQASGPYGPVFLSTGDAGTLSPWLDPLGWAEAATTAPEVPTTTITGTLPIAFAGNTAVVYDAGGRVFFSEVAQDGSFSIMAPAGVYAMVIADATPHERGAFVAAVAGADGPATTPDPLFTAIAPTADLGTLTERDGYLVSTSIRNTTDSDADGTVDASDLDDDNDLILDSTDPDALGDGFDDAVHRADADSDGIAAFWDSDDEGLPEGTDLFDTDGDGVVDVFDADIDNDGIDNAAEQTAHTSRYCYRDRPDSRVGDVNGDGVIDATDVQRLVNMSLRAEPALPQANHDGDGQIKAVDVQQTINRLLEVYFVELGC